MQRIRSHTLGVERGSVLLFSDFESGGEMWTGTGPRERRRRVTFSEAFVRPPEVSVGISMWDMDGDANIRADIAAEAIAAEAFELVFRTWGDTRVARIRADWTAFGELPDPEFWELP